MQNWIFRSFLDWTDTKVYTVNKVSSIADLSDKPSIHSRIIKQEIKFA